MESQLDAAQQQIHEIAGTAAQFGDDLEVQRQVAEYQAELFAAWAVYLLVGYEQAILPRDISSLRWIVSQLLEALDSGRFDSVPRDE